MTHTVTFEISQGVLASLKSGPLDLMRNIRLIAAIDYFREKKLSLGKAAELAGINRIVFMDVLTAKNITHFDFDESEADLERTGGQLLGEIANDHQ